MLWQVTLNCIDPGSVQKLKCVKEGKGVEGSKEFTERQKSARRPATGNNLSDYLRALCDLLLKRIGTEGHEEFKEGKGCKEELVTVVCSLTLRVGSFDAGILPTQRVRLQKAKKSKNTPEFGAPFDPE